MNFKKRVNGSWFDTPHYIHKTDTDTITTLPAIIHPTGSTATVGLKGNTVQNGTPTPDNPVDVNGVGERTENLFDVNGTYSFKDASVTIADNSIKFENVSGSNLEKITYSNQYSAGTYHIYCTASGSNYSAIRLFSNSPFTEARYNAYYNGYYRDFAKSGFSMSLTFDNDFKIGFIANAEGGATFTIHDIMLSTMEADFEPYGYKIPISSGGVTTNIYLGSTQTTRQIKKLELTGTENIVQISGNAPFAIYLSDIANTPDRTYTIWRCSHYQAVSTDKAWSSYSSLISRISTTAKQLCFRDTSIATLEDFKTFLVTQYAAGTPVTIWYAIPTPETAAVNEPLMKIGNYADIVSDISVLVTAGGDTISVDTTVQPSETTVTWAGWHNADVKEYHTDKTISDLEDMTILQMQTCTIASLQGGNWI